MLSNDDGRTISFDSIRLKSLCILALLHEGNKERKKTRRNQ